MSNSKHISQQFLHDRTTTYSLRSRNHSKALVNKTSQHLTSIIRTFNTVTLQLFLLIDITSFCNYRLFTIVFYTLCALLVLYGLRHVKLFIKRI